MLCLLFGITGSVCSLSIQFGRRILLNILKQDLNAAAKMPSESEVQYFKSAFGSKYSMHNNMYCVANGLELHLEQSGDCVVQNMFYNGWTHDHYVGNVFVFAPNGVLIACAINAPGAMHDSIIAEWGGIYKKLKEHFKRYDGRCVMSAAFSKGNYTFCLNNHRTHS